MAARTITARSDRRLVVGLLVGALRWRRLSAWVLAVVAVVAVAGSAAGPMFLRAAADSTLTAAVQQASPGSADVSVITSGGAVELGRLRQATILIGTIGHGRWFSPPVYTVDAGVALNVAGQPYRSDLLWRTGLCGQVRLVAGSCPATAGQVALSARSAAAAGLHLGDTVAVGAPGRPSALTVRLVGLYQPPPSTDTDYWGGSDYFSFGETRPGQPLQLDPLVSDATTAVAGADAGLAPQLSSATYLRAPGLRSAQIGGFERQLAAAVATLGSRFSLTASTQLFSLLGGVRDDVGLMGTVVAAVVVQLVLLALLVVYSVVARSGQDRRLEIDIARRRGFPRFPLLVVAIGESVVLLALALPVGYLLAWATTAVASSALFVAGTAVTLPPASLAAALATFLGGVLAAVAASWGLWRGATRAGERRSAARSTSAAVDAFAVALAAAGLVALSARGSLDGARPDPVALVAPGLLAVGAGVIGLRLAALVVRGALRSSRSSHRVAWFLAVREVARRRPAPLRQVLALCVAVVLAVFGVCSWALASQNRATVAAVRTGAARVVDVAVRPGVNLVTAVREADPGGRSAMAAELYRSQSNDVLAVDASRLAAVAAWPAGLTSLSAAAVGRYLAPATPPPVVFAGVALRATITLSAGAPPLALSATVFNETVEDQAGVTFTAVRPGTRTYVGALRGYCRTTCRLVDLSPSAPTLGAHAPAAVTMTLRALAVGTPGQGWRAVAIGAGRRGAWAAVPPPVTVTSGPRTPGISFSLPVGYLTSQGILLSPATVPAAVPAVLTDTFAAFNAPSPPDNAVAIQGLDGDSLTASGGVEVTTLPEIGADAALINLPFAQDAQTGLSQSTPQVWLTASAPASILTRLASLGVTELSVTSAAAQARLLDRGPLALAYTFVLYSAPVAALLAVGAAAFALLASGRRRRGDLRALTVVGVPRRTVARSVRTETGMVLGAAFLIGGAIGVGATRLALSSLPQFTAGTGGIPLSHRLPLTPLLAVLAAFAAVLTVTAAATSSLALAGPDGDGPPR